MALEVDAASLWPLLSSTLTPDNAARKAAESSLSAIGGKPGYISALMTVITSSVDIPTAVRLTAALALKRAVYAHWHNDAPGTPSTYSPAEKDVVRSQLLAVAVQQADVRMMNAFADVCRWVFRHDFPDRWPTLPADMLALLTSGNPHAILVTCTILREFTKHYETNREGARLVLDRLLAVVLPQVLTIAKYLSEHDDSDQSAHVLRLILKSLSSIIEFHLNEHAVLNSTDAFIGLCGMMNSLLSKHLPEPGEAGTPAGQPTLPDARERWSWWRMKKWVAKVFHRLADRWGQPQLEDDPAMKPIATLFNKHIAPVVCGSLVALFKAQKREGRFISQRVQVYGLHVLQSCVDFASCWKGLLKDEMPFLLQEVVFGLLQLSPDEHELMLNDPHDYLRIATDPMMAHLSPRHAAELLLWAALDTRKAAVEPILDVMMRDGLAAYYAAAPEARNPILKEGLMYLIQDLNRWLTECKQRRKFVETMLVTHITPELASPVACLRARACAVWGAYCGARFTDKATITNAVTGVYQCLNDKEMVVRITAGGVLNAFLMQSKVARKMLKPHVTDVLGKLFSLLEELGVDEVVRTVSTIVEAYSSQVEHLARPMVEHMLRLWREIITDRSEEDGSLEDESALAASGLLQAVQTVVNELFKANKLDVLFALNDLLMPLLDMLFNKEGPTLEFLEEAFSLFGDLIVAYEGHVATLPAMWHIYAKMMHTIQDAAMDYMPSATYPVDALYSYAPDRFAAPADPDTGIDNAALLCSTAAFVESHASESERGLMTRLIISMLHNCRGRVDRLIPGIIALYGKSSQDAHTKLLRSQCFTVVACCLIYNAQLTISAMEAAGLTLPIFAAWFTGLHAGFYLRSLDCKLSMLGLTCILRLPLASLPGSLVPILPQVFAAIASLQIRYEELLKKEEILREQEDDEDDEDEEGFDFGDDDEEDDDEAAIAAALAAEEAADAPATKAVADDDDFVSAEDAAYVKMLQEVKHKREAGELAAAATAAHGASDLPDGDDDLDAPPATTPVDHIQHLLHIQEAVMMFASQPGASAVQAAVHADVQGALHKIVEVAMNARARGTQPGEFGPAPSGH